MNGNVSAGYVPVTEDYFLFIIVVLIMGIVVVFPWLMNTYVIYSMRNKVLDKIDISSIGMKNCNSSESDSEDLKILKTRIEMERVKIAHDMVRQLPQRKGLSRFSLMSAVILIIGTSVLYLVIFGKSEELLKSTIGVLTGALATIIGFYFGGRAEQVKVESIEEIIRREETDNQ
ncbi:hypothetical protein F1737_08695 [Methanoplanus sp. FWC-SCC4]|uniref:Uncharacterized protein n=1 Tax=Methanochimaera problematica TaxID=2609417 RepID=A0AA97FEW2_9EURY|nr:hypothetical protein [Methanoplanus sp. FWC-SCC4]WOF16763.1 hypothetical protein F1737_08695 [Methanoplanus sp. FWC-SCC4]